MSPLSNQAFHQKFLFVFLFHDNSFSYSLQYELFFIERMVSFGWQDRAERMLSSADLEKSLECLLNTDLNNSQQRVNLSVSAGSSCTCCTLFLCPTRRSDASLSVYSKGRLYLISFLGFQPEIPPPPSPPRSSGAFVCHFCVSLAAHQPVSPPLTCGWCYMTSKKKISQTTTQNIVLMHSINKGNTIRCHHSRRSPEI